jgi:hypothetical protein
MPETKTTEDHKTKQKRNKKNLHAEQVAPLGQKRARQSETWQNANVSSASRRLATKGRAKTKKKKKKRKTKH